MLKLIHPEPGYAIGAILAMGFVAFILTVTVMGMGSRINFERNCLETGGELVYQVINKPAAPSSYGMVCRKSGEVE